MAAATAREPSDACIAARPLPPDPLSAATAHRAEQPYGSVGWCSEPKRSATHELPPPGDHPRGPPGLRLDPRLGEPYAGPLVGRCEAGLARTEPRLVRRQRPPRRDRTGAAAPAAEAEAVPRLPARGPCHRLGRAGPGAVARADAHVPQEAGRLLGEDGPP